MKKALAALLIAALTLMGCALAEEAAVPELIEAAPGHQVRCAKSGGTL